MTLQFWGVMNDSEAGSTRVYRKSNFKKFRTKGLGRNPSTKRLTVAYFPFQNRDIVLHRRGSLPPWYAPLEILKDYQGSEIDLFYGTLSVGTWILDSVNFDNQNWMLARPAKVVVSMSFTEVDRDWPEW